MKYCYKVENYHQANPMKQLWRHLTKTSLIFRCFFFLVLKTSEFPSWLGTETENPGITSRCWRTWCELGFTHTHTWWPGLRHRPGVQIADGMVRVFQPLKMWVFKGVTGFPPLKLDLSFMKFIHSETCFYPFPTQNTHLISPLGVDLRLFFCEHFGYILSLKP